MKFCPECGTKAEGFKFCPECGYRLPGGEGAQQAAAIQPAALDFGGDAFDWDNLSSAGSVRMQEMAAQAEADALAAFTWEKHQNEKYVILALKDKSEMSIVVPANVEAIGPGAFEGSEVIEVTLPEGLMKIGDRAFADCVELTQIRLPQSLMIIGQEAFAGCVHLDVTPPERTRVGKDAFKDTLQAQLNTMETETWDFTPQEG